MSCLKTVCLSRQAGWECREDKDRGFDHGAFVPLYFVFPEANIPVVQLSLMSNMDAKVNFMSNDCIHFSNLWGLSAYREGDCFAGNIICTVQSCSDLFTIMNHLSPSKIL